jgi:DNA/RNA-binding domain of Phe-tRNA-synthetase-like protein
MTPEDADLVAAAGTVEADVRAEFPGLRLAWVTVPGRAGPSPRPVAQRLRELSSRYRGANVIAMRTQPIPHAYRVFFRQIGLDPDVDRIPSERAAVARLLGGGFTSRDLVADARLLALIETGVPVWAIDADHVDAGGLGIRTARPRERLGSAADGDPLPPGGLVVADARRVHAILFGKIAPGHSVGAGTRRMVLFSVGVDGVPAIHVEEALWLCVEALGAG